MIDPKLYSFYTDLGRLFHPNYQPTYDDVCSLQTLPGVMLTAASSDLSSAGQDNRYHGNCLHAQVTYIQVGLIAVKSCTADRESSPLRMFDVGGQRSERRKWIHCFEVRRILSDARVARLMH